MGAAGSIEGKIGLVEFKRLREEYEKKLQSGITDVELFDHMNNLIQNLPSLNNHLDSQSNGANNIPSIELINDQTNPNNNCSDHIKQKIKLNLLTIQQHPLSIIKQKLEEAMKIELKRLQIDTIEEQIFSNPLVTINQNFDSLLISSNHYSRRASDVYYLTENILLRTHLTAYLSEIFQKNSSSLQSTPAGGYFITGPIYRRVEEDDINSELSHQLELVCVFDHIEESSYVDTAANIIQALLPPNSKLRWEELDEIAYLKDSLMSFETLFQGQPLELVRGGLLSLEVIAKLGLEKKEGFLLTFDLDHLVMVINSVSSIRDVQQHVS